MHDERRSKSIKVEFDTRFIEYLRDYKLES